MKTGTNEGPHCSYRDFLIIRLCEKNCLSDEINVIFGKISRTLWNHLRNINELIPLSLFGTKWSFWSMKLLHLIYVNVSSCIIPTKMYVNNLSSPFVFTFIEVHSCQSLTESNKILILWRFLWHFEHRKLFFPELICFANDTPIIFYISNANVNYLYISILFHNDSIEKTKQWVYFITRIKSQNQFDIKLKKGKKHPYGVLVFHDLPNDLGNCNFSKNNWAWIWLFLNNHETKDYLEKYLRINNLRLLRILFY